MPSIAARHRRSTAPFGPVDVDYDERVLTPRPWTVAQSEWAAELAAGAEPGRLLELCAGAGQIGLAAALLADRDLLQIEADPVAAEYARFNAVRAGWGARTEVRIASLDDALTADERFGLVIADPPYLPSDALAQWPDDPVSAIDGGTDGLDLIRLCLALGAAHLTPQGRMVLQVAGPAQADQVAQLLLDMGCPLVASASRVIDDGRAIVQLSRP